MKEYNFDEIIDRRGINCVKYDDMEKYFGRDDLLPLWVADMDFHTPDFILDAIKQRCEHPILAYSFAGDDYYNSIIKWIHDLHDWDIKREWLSFIPGIVKGIGFVVDRFTRKGDKVIIQPPVYHPFRIVPESLRREVVYNPLRLENGRYEMDFDNLESVIDEHCKVLILSNPHNPAGIVWSKDTLAQLAAICKRHNILVVSDEIHSEMVYPEFKHCPFATASDDAAACSITFAAPSKTFNIAGVVASYAIVPDEQIRNEFYSFLEAGEFNAAPLFSYIVTTAAYTHGAEWRRQMLEYVVGNINFVDKFLKENIPQIKVYRPQASFLVWLDCRGLGLSHDELIDLFVNKAHLALNDGAMFGKEGTGFMRLNIGCPREILKKALEQLGNGFWSNGSRHYFPK